MLDFVPLIALALLVVQVVNFLKYAKAKNANGALTIFLAWTAGVAVLLLFAQTDFASGIQVGDATLDTLNLASLIVVGMTLASTGSFAVDIKKAFDTSDSAKVPPLFDE